MSTVSFSQTNAAPESSALPTHKAAAQSLYARSETLTLQPKLLVNQPGDRFEQEAEQIAAQVVNMPEAKVQRDGGSTCPKCLEEKGGHCNLQRAAASTSASRGVEVPSSVHSVLRTPGQPMELATRGFYEPRFGHDFSKVRVHKDSRASRSAEDVNAKAYTVHNKIVFASNLYQPDTSKGRRLLAHELAHVVQQGGATPDVHRAAGPSVGATLPSNCGALQRVADKSNPPGDLGCDRIDAGPGRPVGTHIVFDQGGHGLDPVGTALIEAEFAAWDARGRVDQITVDGFASSEGAASINWKVSCSRAEAVEAEFLRLGVSVGMVTTIAHGETEEFSSTDLPPNRRAVIRIVPAAQPTPAPACPTTITASTTLTTDCPNGIVVAANNIVLDGAGHTLTGPGTGNGILLRGRTGVRIVNIQVTGFNNGIAIRDSRANTLTNNSSFRNSTDGIDINDSNDNLFLQNNVSNNTDHGIELDGSSSNRFIQNTVNANDDGFDTEGPPRDGPPAPSNIFRFNSASNNRGAGFRMLSNDNTLTGNSSNNNEAGFRIQGNDNVLSGNSAGNNTEDGYRIQGNDNTLSGNSANSNTRDGYRISGDDNTLTGNSGSGNRSDDVDVRNNTTGNSCTGNSFGSTNGQCSPDVP